MEGARVALEGDLGRCAALLREAERASGTARGARLLADLGPFGGRDDPATPVDPERRVAAWFADGGGTSRLLAGTIDGLVVGLAAATVRAGPPIVGRIECCYVEPAARGVGVGGSLVTALIGWFSDIGCSGVDALALPGDREMKQLLETAGFKTRLLVLHRSPS